jgi:hypothetical protein
MSFLSAWSILQTANQVSINFGIGDVQQTLSIACNSDSHCSNTNSILHEVQIENSSMFSKRAQRTKHL